MLPALNLHSTFSFQKALILALICRKLFFSDTEALCCYKSLLVCRYTTDFFFCNFFLFYEFPFLDFWEGNLLFVGSIFINEVKITLYILLKNNFRERRHRLSNHIVIKLLNYYILQNFCLSLTRVSRV